MTGKIVLVLIVTCFCFSSNVTGQQTYTVLGTVVDSQSNQPISDTQVWLYGSQAGDVTDSNGQYKFEIYSSYSETRLYVRRCGDKIANSKLVSFAEDSIVQADFSIEMDDVECPKLPNMPWKVDSSEYETYKVHLYSGLHGVFFKTCSGNTYKPVWTPDFEENSIWPDNGNQGGRVFIELLGRLDPYSKGVIPSQSLYVGQIINIDREKSEYCE